MAKRRNYRQVNGILLLDKPVGLSSNKALQEARTLFKADKAGHTGSLDPLASGMLPICFGEATKVSGFLLDSDKHYLTEAQLGFNSDTGDAEGHKTPVGTVPELTKTQLETLLAAFHGEVEQIPPMYSALKKDGQPLYKLARQGINVERESRTVTIHALQLSNFNASQLSLSVHCSKGTYIRSLVEDIGEALGCGAYVSMLRRVAVSPFADYPMYTLDELRRWQTEDQSGLDALLLPVDAALPHFMPFLLTSDDVLRIRQGKRLLVQQAAEQEGIVRLYEQITQRFIGLGIIQAGVLRAKRLLAY